MPIPIRHEILFGNGPGPLSGLRAAIARLSQISFNIANSKIALVDCGAMKHLICLLALQLGTQLFVAFVFCLALIFAFSSKDGLGNPRTAFRSRGAHGSISGDPNVSLEWISQALAAQMLYQETIPMRLLQPASTHNSFLSHAEGYGLCGTLSFALQNWTLGEQIRVGIRQLELDIFRVGAELIVCHPCYDQCQVAARLCNRSLGSYAAPGVPVGSSVFGCDPRINLSFKAALNRIWENCLAYMDEHPKRREREMLILHLQLHVDEGLSQLANHIDSDPWISQFIADLQTSLLNHAIVPALFRESTGALAESSIETLRRRTPQTLIPPMWVLPVVDMIDPSSGSRALANSSIFTNRNSPLSNLVVPNFSPLEYPEDRLIHLGENDSCTLAVRGLGISQLSRNFTYFVGSIFSTRKHIADAYRCGFAVRADMPSYFARQEALLGMIWSWKLGRPIPDLSNNAAGNFSRPTYMDAKDCRWSVVNRASKASPTLWLCTWDPPERVGARATWDLVPDRKSFCHIDIPRTGYENTLACAVLRENRVAMARLGIDQSNHYAQTRAA
ncbi:hypothetical protein CCYA_CCYA19G4713 [Cyanidiococcus yangmingshanensis]|nr:hypothetical protein CCYA_CCYA19G4713 [Cyanidiococcus yangmingshanensis]